MHIILKTTITKDGSRDTTSDVQVKGTNFDTLAAALGELSALLQVISERTAEQSGDYHRFRKIEFEARQAMYAEASRQPGT